jgi:hypothetical protein
VTDEVEQSEPLDSAISGSWLRLTDDPDVRGVEVSRLADGDPWPWQIGVFAAEFVREEPFESEFRQRIGAAIRSVAGIAEVVEEDREVWMASGDPDGSELARSVGAAVDAMVDQIRAAMEIED